MSEIPEKGIINVSPRDLRNFGKGILQVVHTGYILKCQFCFVVFPHYANKLATQIYR